MWFKDVVCKILRITFYKINSTYTMQSKIIFCQEDNDNIQIFKQNSFYLFDDKTENN